MFRPEMFRPGMMTQRGVIQIRQVKPREAPRNQGIPNTDIYGARSLKPRPNELQVEHQDFHVFQTIESYI